MLPLTPESMNCKQCFRTLQTYFILMPIQRNAFFYVRTPIDLVILEDEFRACCDEFIIMTDDGSYGEKGVVTAPLEQRIVGGANFDEVITIGPLIMMKFVVKTTKPHNVKTVVSMNPIMVDGTGMCGGCRLTVGGQTKFACVDGPDFDGFEVDFDEAMHRGTMYKPFEAHAREAECNLLKQEVQ